VSGSTQPLTGGQVRAAVSDAIVRLMHRYYGKGPTKAKTYLVDDYLLCVLQDMLTAAEETLIERGRGDLVRQVRLAFQEEMRDEFTSAVERITGRRVLGYHSQVSFDPPMGFEIFVLEPNGGEASGEPLD
jgi:uncharacterized protein YbcI